MCQESTKKKDKILYSLMNCEWIWNLRDIFMHAIVQGTNIKEEKSNITRMEKKKVASYHKVKNTKLRNRRILVENKLMHKSARWDVCWAEEKKKIILYMIEGTNVFQVWIQNWICWMMNKIKYKCWIMNDGINKIRMLKEKVCLLC